MCLVLGKAAEYMSVNTSGNLKTKTSENFLYDDQKGK